jgi:hypothetical protein
MGINANNNHLCRCASGKKFKKCCKTNVLKNGEMSPTKWHHFHKVQVEETTPKICLHLEQDNLRCSSKIIKAHSIQKSRVLQEISEDDQVLMVKFEPPKNRYEPAFSFKRIKVKSASVFKNFCDYHDNKIFEPIEKQPYLGTSEQNFLLLIHFSDCASLYVSGQLSDAKS